MRPPRLPTLGALGLVLVTSGCGSSGAAPTATGSTTTTSTPTTAASTIFHLAAPATSPTCTQATASGSPEVVISAFRAARIAGKGADGCLTSRALAAYCGPRQCGPELFSGPNAPSPGPICLYSCNGQTVRSITVDSAHKDPSGTVSVLLTVSGSANPTQGAIDHEQLTLGPGVPSTSPQPEPMVIFDATTSA